MQCRFDFVYRNIATDLPIVELSRSYVDPANTFGKWIVTILSQLKFPRFDTSTSYGLETCLVVNSSTSKKVKLIAYVVL